MAKKIIVKGAKEHNLKGIDVEIEHDSLTVITGVSGSGKSSLAFDTICNEGQRLYLETLPSYAKLYTGKLSKPNVDSISGLRATVSVSQQKSAGNIRSTVGTVTELFDILRLLFARLGKYEGHEKGIKLERSLFSFNSPKGACPECKGLGIKEKIEPEFLIKDENLSIREGALIPTTPTGYIVYSQVTVDVLGSICQKHGFNIDIAWKDLKNEDKHVIFFGSDKIKVPFGKHTLESRIKWSGITAKPREEGYYRGLLPIMEEILKRDRNKNILRFTKSVQCPVCNGDRLNQVARSVYFKGKNIAQLNNLSIRQLETFLTDIKLSANESLAVDQIKQAMNNRIWKLKTLGLDYLALSRETTSLSSGELQRIRLATQTGTGLSGILYVFDEPSIGLHHRDNLKLIELFKKIKKNGNTLCIVEHDKEIMAHADKIIDIGPGAGINGGKVLINDSPENLLKYKNTSHTASYFLNEKMISENNEQPDKDKWIRIIGAKKFNLKNISVSFKYNGFNVVTGVSGAGKSTLIKRTLGLYAKMFFEKHKKHDCSVEKIEGLDRFGSIIEIDSTPIGRTPRSNPATYTNLFDHIRDLFSTLPEAKEKQLKKSHFSFNVVGGRCEECQGAGIKSVGMFFLGDVKILCDKCHGKRFNEDILRIKYKGKNIFDILEMSFKDASDFFSSPKIKQIVETINNLGLDYLKLGQPATTLSGGEAQRIKLASRLSKSVKGRTLYLFDEPTIGLSDFDIQILLNSLFDLIKMGHTVIIIEHNLDLISSADHIVDLGPESGNYGGTCVASGSIEDIINSKSSHTGKALREYLNIKSNSDSEKIKPKTHSTSRKNFIEMKDICTNNLKNISVKIPKNKFTVVTGVSGSGKSSLVFDSLYNEAHKKFIERLSIYARQFLKSLPPSDIGEVSGLTPSIGIKQNIHSNNPRSTIGTMSGIYDLYRLLYSRVGVQESSNQPGLYSECFSFNHNSGACPKCNGLGFIISVDPSILISRPGLPFFKGAIDKHETGKFYGDEFGQYKAILFKAGEDNNIDYSQPVEELSKKAIDLALYGTGEKTYSVDWKFKRKNRTGSFKMKQPWKGFVNLIDEEYSRKSMQTRGKKIKELMMEIKCAECNGERLNKVSRSVKFLDKNIYELSNLSIKNTINFFNKKASIINTNPVSSILIQEIFEKLNIINEAGLEYLSLNRRVNSISHGEYRRLQLAVQMVNGLQDMTYILDEPTQGLHSKDIKKLLSLLNKLKKNNTIIAVEHDLDVIRSSDFLIDLGPGAGTAGGEIVASGTVKNIMDNPNSKTGKFLKENRVFINRNQRKLNKGFTLKGIKIHNIENLDIYFPRGGIIALSGVSGSGKSSLLFKVVFESLKSKNPKFCKSLEGNYVFDEIVRVTQSQIGNTPLSNPATYTGIFDSIRTYFSKSKNAVSKKLTKKHFAFNSKDGQCTGCKGMGKIKVSMDFLSDIWISCEECNGKRYKDEIISCSVNGVSIDQLLNKTITEAKIYFKTETEIENKLNTLTDISLGYLKLGQGLNTLSGGEAQRLKIAKELIQSKKDENNKLFLLDEPTTGLHFEDIKTLINLFRKLSDKGHTLIVIEHDLNIISNADWIIDMGPEGGDRGGKVIAAGTPEEIINCKKSYTGEYLKEFIH